MHYKDLRFDAGTLDLSLNQININHQVDLKTAQTTHTHSINKGLEASKTTFRGSPRFDITSNQNGRNYFATNNNVMKPQQNIMDEIYTRRNQNKNTKRYDAKKPASMIRVTNNQIPEEKEIKLPSEQKSLSMVRGVKAGTEVA